VQRIVVLASVFAASLAAVAAGAALLRWDSALEEGAREKSYWSVLDNLQPTELPQLRFLGDSTVLPSRIPTYPYRLGRQLAGHVDVRTTALIGASLWESYFLTGPAADADPTVVALVVNLRTLPSDADRPDYQDLAALIPAEELPRAMTLPLHEIGMSLPRLLLLRGLRSERVREVVQAAGGLRTQLGRAHPVWIVPEPVLDLAGERGRARAFREYDAPVRAHQGTLRAMQAALGLLERREIASLVVISPIPIDALHEAGLAAPETMARRIARIRSLAEARGAVVVDLHDLLLPEGFIDHAGHFSKEGSRAVARALRRPLVELLEREGVTLPPYLRHSLLEAPKEAVER
jgi:hypothetical protein